MIETKVVIVNCIHYGCCSSSAFRGFGFHSGPSARFAHLVRRFDSSVELEAKGETIDPSSHLGIMALGLGVRLVARLRCSGSDEEQAMIAITDFLGRGAGENLCDDYRRFRERLNEGPGGPLSEKDLLAQYAAHVEDNPRCPLVAVSEEGPDSQQVDSSR